jgi:hypothetical protein
MPSKICPKCDLVNPYEAGQCDCGFSFVGVDAGAVGVEVPKQSWKSQPNSVRIFLLAIIILGSLTFLASGMASGLNQRTFATQFLAYPSATIIFARLIQSLELGRAGRVSFGYALSVAGAAYLISFTAVFLFALAQGILAALLSTEENQALLTAYRLRIFTYIAGFVVGGICQAAVFILALRHPHGIALRLKQTSFYVVLCYGTLALLQWSLLKLVRFLPLR